MSETKTKPSRHDEFMEADAEFSKIMREYNEVADRLWAATKRRSAAWTNLRDGSNGQGARHG